MEYRVESDSIGETAVPAGALYGAQTARALANFPIGEERMPAAIWMISFPCRSFAQRCIAHMKPERGTISRHLDRFLMLVTTLANFRFKAIIFNGLNYT